MFLRRKPNASGTFSVQVVMKDCGRYVVVRSIGSSSDESELSRMELKARDFIRRYGVEFDLPSVDQERIRIFSSIQSIVQNGPHLILDHSIIDNFVQRFQLTDFIVVADAGLLSRKNINQRGYNKFHVVQNDVYVSIDLSVDRAMDIAKTISTVKIKLANGATAEQTILTTAEQRLFAPLLTHRTNWVSQR